MKKFDLKEYLGNPKRKVVTRNGRPIRIICTNMKNSIAKPNIILNKKQKQIFIQSVIMLILLK